MRIRFLFWNLNNRPLQSSVAALASEKQLSVIILAECTIQPDEILSQLRSAGEDGFTFARSYAESAGDIQIFARLPGDEIRPVADDPNNHVTMRRIVLAGNQDLLLVAVHLQSKVNWSNDDQVLGATALAKQISERETSFSHRRTILVGDLNMNPFETGVIGAGGLHAVMTKAIAAAHSRIVNANECFYFYNPMWRFFGERADGPPGTYYLRRSGKPISFFWNIFDQVMVRPVLMNALEDVQILNRIGNASLLDQFGIPDKNVGSDHLPLAFSLNL